MRVSGTRTKLLGRFFVPGRRVIGDTMLLTAPAHAAILFSQGQMTRNWISESEIYFIVMLSNTSNLVALMTKKRRSPPHARLHERPSMTCKELKRSGRALDTSNKSFLRECE